MGAKWAKKSSTMLLHHRHCETGHCVTAKTKTVGILNLQY